jgi:thiamine biosynthesis lipoprotein
MTVSVLAACVTNAAAAHVEPRLVVRETSAMGTEVRISVYTSDDEEKVAHAIDAAFAEFARLEALMTTWREDSEVSRINAVAGERAVQVSPETLEVIEAAQLSSKRSGGAFDITFDALKGLWKFDQDLERKIPDEAAVRQRLGLIDYRKVIIDHKKRTVKLAAAGMRINLGGIAKGYAVDRAVKILRKAGYQNALVQAGGDLMCAGSKGGKPWKAGIRDPRGARDQFFAALALTNHAFSTAGDYERYFLMGGQRYHHILDPKTGHPATKSRSVTLYAPTALLADALDDAVFIMGWEKGIELVEKIPDVGAVVVDSENKVHVSKRMRDKVEILRNPTDGF